MIYLGMNAQTGRRITDMDHITQSITDIVTTPITTRCMRRGYGSLLSDLIDAAVTAKSYVGGLQRHHALGAACGTDPRVIGTAAGGQNDAGASGPAHRSG